jgi:hypothetical protein
MRLHAQPCKSPMIFSLYSCTPQDKIRNLEKMPKYSLYGTSRARSLNDAVGSNRAIDGLQVLLGHSLRRDVTAGRTGRLQISVYCTYSLVGSANDGDQL